MKILFDVGANSGSNSLTKIQNNNDWMCFAFEPTPKLFNELIEQSKNISDRYYVYSYAISDIVGKSKFNIAGQHDWGCSSLLEFSENLDQTWPGRKDFKVTETISVEVITLEKFITEICPIDLRQIDFFHCDTQGTDLRVLKGLGQYISLIKEGVIETARDSTVQLYKNQHTKEESIKFLEENNFSIVKVEPNDIYKNELNIYFQKKI